ncbi:MAG: protein translocase subunit SecF [Burkholderiales bacterium]|nr:protein translocase subunit SecF [Burkholderiales bacterium]
MEFFRISRDVDFMKRAFIFNAISFITFLLAVFFLVSRGLNFSIEFTGGVVVEAQYQQAAELEKLRSALLRAGVGEPQVQNFGTSRDVMLRLAVKDASLPSISTDGKLDIAKLGSEVLSAGGDAPKVTRVEFIGPQVGKELANDGAIALGLVIFGIMVYLAVRFEWKFAVAAIIANLHDVIIILGFFAFFQWEFSLSVLAAVLAVLGYSVNESVVVFDRIREVFRKARNLTVPQVVNHAITSTISRTIITHGSTQLMVTSMLIFGGPTLHYFALALTIGILFGIYSSVLVASPIVIWLGVSREDLIKPIKKEDATVESV